MIDKSNMTPAERAEDNKNFTYEIKQRIATISRYGNTTKELNLISYRGKPAKYDLRSWVYEGADVKLGKGITLTNEEMEKLRQAIVKLV